MLQINADNFPIPYQLLNPASVIFFVVYGLIIFRNLRRVNLPVWVIMFAGAVAVIFLNGISLKDAYSAVNLDVIFFLIGMFSVVSGLEASGLLRYFTVRILTFAGSPQRVLLFILVALGTMSAFLMNDTIAVAATPIVIGLARAMKVRPAPFLITLAFAVSIGSTMTPMGNPQNLLIALSSGIRFQFFDFLRLLTVPTIINYFATYFILKLYYRKEIRGSSVPEHLSLVEAITDVSLAKSSGAVTLLTIAGFFALSISRVLGFETDLNFGTIAMLGSAILYAISPRRREIIKGINWSIIIFFISMFIVMQSVWNAGLIHLFASFLPPLTHVNSPLTILNIIGVSVVLSQVMSNVPFVAVYINLMKGLGFSSMDVEAWVALAGASTLAGNLTILGAASTIIILEVAEEKGHSFSFYEYLKIGSIVTLANIVVLSLWLIFI
ncbi:MAG: citrate transporter [Thaumarchaeota archaeon]|nr:citrate transporter [Nitrososphaerota archaeon]